MNGQIHQQSYRHGVPDAPLYRLPAKQKTQARRFAFIQVTRHVFADTEYHYDILAKRLRELSFLEFWRVRILSERRAKRIKKIPSAYEGGIRAFVEHLNVKIKHLLHDTGLSILPPTTNDVGVELAMQWNDGLSGKLYIVIPITSRNAMAVPI